MPRNQRKDVLHICYDNAMSGHLGKKKNWVVIRSDVEEWCRACRFCCAKVGPVRSHHIPLKVYPVGERIPPDVEIIVPSTKYTKRL